jgi:ABC-2 type transport system permease protein
MRKILQIAHKDLILIVRDPMALVFYLLAPFLLTLGMAAITGSFSSTDSGLSNIPIVITNADHAQLGDSLVEVFQSEELDSLMEPVLKEDFETARKLVDDRKAVAALLIPEGFTSSIIPQTGQPVSADNVQLQLYTDGESIYSIGVIRTIIETFLSELESTRASYSVSLTKMLTEGLIHPEELPEMIEAFSSSTEPTNGEANAYKIVSNDQTFESGSVSYLAMIAPGMALMFLMYNVTAGGVSFLIERREYTLQRNLVSPTRSYQIIIGKSLGIFLRGFAQVLILVLTSALLFRLDWGNRLGVLLLIAFSTYGALGWGMFLTSFLKTPAQVSSTGSAISLLFGLVGGGFLPMSGLPDWLKTAARISPNAWGSQGFTILAAGGSLGDLKAVLLALFLMGTLLLSTASIFFRRNVIQVNG